MLPHYNSSASTFNPIQFPISRLSRPNPLPLISGVYLKTVALVGGLQDDLMDYGDNPVRWHTSPLWVALTTVWNTRTVQKKNPQIHMEPFVSSCSTWLRGFRAIVGRLFVASHLLLFFSTWSSSSLTSCPSFLYLNKLSHLIVSFFSSYFILCHLISCLISSHLVMSVFFSLSCPTFV